MYMSCINSSVALPGIELNVCMWKPGSFTFWRNTDCNKKRGRFKTSNCNNIIIIDFVLNLKNQAVCCEELNIWFWCCINCSFKIHKV